MHRAQVTKFVLYGFYTFLVVSLIVLIATSIIVHDVSFIKANPRGFFIESFFVTMGMTLALAYGLKFSRGIRIRDNLVMMITIVVKVLIFHVLLELSGVYSATLKE